MSSCLCFLSLSSCQCFWYTCLFVCTTDGLHLGAFVPNAVTGFWPMGSRRLTGAGWEEAPSIYWEPCIGIPLLLLLHLYLGRVQSAPKKIGLGCAQGASSCRHNYNGNAKLGPYTFKKEKPFTFPTEKLLSFCQVASWTQFYNWPYCKFVRVMLLQRKDISESKKGDIAGISGGDENGSKLGGKKYENWWKVVKRGHLGGSCHRGQPPLKLSHIGLTHPIPCPSPRSLFWHRPYCSPLDITLFWLVGWQHTRLQTNFTHWIALVFSLK